VSEPTAVRRRLTSARSMEVRTLPAVAREQARMAWARIEQTIGPEVPPFCRWSWTDLWLTHFGDLVPHQFWIAERNGRVCGAVLVTRDVERRGPLPIRRLHLGTAGERPDESVFVEYNGLCAAAWDRHEFAAAIVAQADRTRRWDELVLDGFVADHAEAIGLAASGTQLPLSASPVLDLASDGRGLIATLPAKSVRALLRRSLRGMEPYETEWATTADSALEIMDDLQQLHQRRWRARGERGAFSSARKRAFHRALVASWLPAGRAAMFAVRRHGEVLGAVYGFVVGDTLQYYQGGFRTDLPSKIRPGYATHLLAAEAARQRGLRFYEFLAGEARYKDELATSRRYLVWATLPNRRPRARMIRAARAAKRVAGALVPGPHDRRPGLDSRQIQGLRREPRSSRRQWMATQK